MTVCGCTRASGSFANSRIVGDLPSPLRGRTELLEDLLVRVATAHARAKGGELGLVDAHGSTLA